MVQKKKPIEIEAFDVNEIVRWIRYKDGQIIIESERIKMVKESDETFALIIERVKIEDSGSYSVVASNAMGQMSEFWQMVANAPPTFLQQLIKESQANEGENITFEVKVEGNPAPTLKWFSLSSLLLSLASLPSSVNDYSLEGWKLSHVVFRAVN